MLNIKLKFNFGMQRFKKNIKAIHRIYIHLLLWMLLCNASGNIYAQLFPVNVNVVLVPPYSLRISDYGTSMTDKLIVNLLLRDISSLNRKVGLRLFIESNRGINVKSRDQVIGALPITLNGGSLVRLTNTDLQAYFSFQNLVGMSPQQFQETLPEGVYRFCFEVFDFNTGVKLSQKSCASAFLLRNDPPFLNYPKRGDIITESGNQNIIFQWTPRHLNANNVAYEFTMAEIWDDKMDPQAAFLASRPIYQTSTSNTMLLYGPGEPALLPNKMYAWRVRAIVSDGISESAVFKNNGYSEIYHFIHTAPCGIPKFILSENHTPSSQKMIWQSADAHLSYRVKYRKKNAEVAYWFEQDTSDPQLIIKKLEPGSTYEYKVGAKCLEQMKYSYSQVFEFTTMLNNSENPTYECGIAPEVIITNKKPLERLNTEDVFTAGDFPVVVKEAQGSGGVFSGSGYITVPYLSNFKIKVIFDKIKINTDYQLYEGEVKTDYDANWKNVKNVTD